MKNNKNTTQELPDDAHDALLKTLQARFVKHMSRHVGMTWADVKAKLEANPEKLWSLGQMENTGGEPDVIDYDPPTGEYIFADCSPESPAGRRNACYDREALDARKSFKPEHNAIDLASEMGIELLTEEQYHALQALGEFDMKTSSWLKTPADVRKKGGAIFGDRRYGRVFIYHNGADSYYGARGFRGILKV